MQRRPAFLVALLLDAAALAAVPGLTACLHRLDPADVFSPPVAPAAWQRFDALSRQPRCQEQLRQDDAQCWERRRDRRVAVETGVSRTLRPQLVEPYAVQTHLKVRVQGAAGSDVYYFADAGAGGLDLPAGGGAADGHINVFCAVAAGEWADFESYENQEVSQAAVDEASECVHRALLRDPSFGPEVEICLAPVRSAHLDALASRVRSGRAAWLPGVDTPAPAERKRSPAPPTHGAAQERPVDVPVVREAITRGAGPLP